MREDSRAELPPIEVTDKNAWRALLRRGASGAFLVTVAGAGLGFVAHLVVARLTGKVEYGIYALMLSWVSVLATVAQAGQDTNVVRFLPTYLLRGEWGKARGLRLGIGLLVLAISCLIAIVGCVVIHIVGTDKPAGWRATFYIGFAMLPVLTQLQQSGAMHRASKRAVASGFYVAVVRPICLLGLLALFWVLGLNLDAPLAAIASGSGALLALIATAWHLSRGWPRAGRGARREYELGRWARTGVQLSLLSIVIVAGNRLDVLLVGGMLGTNDVGPYYAAVQIAGFALYGLQAVNVVLAPLISERYDVGDLQGLQAIARRAARISFWSALFIACIAATVGYWVLSWFGPGFASAYPALLTLAMGYVVGAAAGSPGFFMSMTALQKSASAFAALGVLANCALAALLIPTFGVVGAAAGASLGFVIWRLASSLYVKAKLGISTSVV